MAQTESQSIPREQFLTMAVNLLHRALIENTRTESKKIFREISEGKGIVLSNVQMEDKSTVRFDLSLDHTEYAGKLNYGAFRSNLATLLSNLASALNEKRDINTFGAQGDSSNMIFGVTGVTVEREVPAIMVLSSKVSSREAAVMLRLMYLDHQQFLANPEPGDEEAQPQV